MARRSSAIDVDLAAGTVAFHDSRRKLRRAFLFWWAAAVVGGGLAAICGGIIVLAFLTKKVAIFGLGKLGVGKAFSKALAVLFGGIVNGLGLLGFGLYRQARCGRRYFDPDPDLVVSPQGLDDRWLGIGLLPWERIADAALDVDRSTDRLGIAIRLRNLDGWLGTLPDTQWMRIKGRLRLADGAGDSYRLSQTGGDTLEASLHDILFVLACHVPVSGLPAGYRPAAAALQDIAPPTANLFRPPADAEPADGAPIPFQIVTRRMKLLGRTLLLTGILAIPFLLLLWLAMPENVALLFKLLAAFLALAVVQQLRLVFQRQPVIDADAEGLWLSPFAYLGRIAWTDILAIDLRTEKDWNRLRVGLAMPDAYARHLSPLRRLLHGCRVRFGATLRVTLLFPDEPVPAAVERMRDFRRRALAAQSPAGPVPAADNTPRTREPA